MILIISILLILLGIHYLKKSKDIKAGHHENSSGNLIIEEAENCIKAFNSCYEILQTTTDPQLFFLNMDLFEDQISIMSQLSSEIDFSVSADIFSEASIKISMK